MEEWRDVIVDKEEADTYKGLYQVSNLGRVKRLYKDKERVLKPRFDKKGYVVVCLSKNNKSKEYKVHRLVGLAFLGDTYFENAQIDHINTIREDNNVNNLRWVSNSENCNNKLTRKHKSEAFSGENHPFYGKHHSDETKQKISKANKGRKYSDETKRKMGHKRDKHPQARAVMCITTGEIFTTIEEGAEHYGIKSSSNITNCCKGKKKSCGKHPTTNEPLVWKYLDE